MAQRAPVKKSMLPLRDPRQMRVERWAAYTATGRPQPLQPLPPKPQFSLMPFLVGGFLLLQMMALLVALLILLPTQPQAGQPILIALVTASPTVAVQPVIPQQFPTPTPINPALPTPPPAEILPTPLPTAVEGSPTPIPPATLKLRGLEITQGIQVFDEPELSPCQPDLNHPAHIFCNNSVPLVAGRHTLVRVYPICADTCPSGDVMFRLHVLKDGQEQTNLTQTLPPATLQRLNNLALLDLRLHLENSVNFEFFPPPAWMAGQITFQLEAISQAEPNQAPVTLALTKDFAVHKSLRVAYLPIDYRGVRPPELSGVDYWLLRMYPVPDVEYYRLPVPDLTWEGELDKGELLRQLLHIYWLYTQTQPAETWPDQLFGWLSPELYNGGASDPAWCPNCAGSHSSRVGFGGLRPEQDIGGPRVLVHEIAHNLGAQHAWSPTQRQDATCFKAEGADIWVDPAWPYLQTPHIQEVGLDLYSSPPVIYPPSTYDMMAYCAQPWISPYTYRKIFDSPLLQPNAAAPQPLTNIQPSSGTGQAGVLLVSAMISPDGSVSQPEVIRLEGSSFTSAADINPPPGNDYCLDVQATDNTPLAHQCFAVGFTDVETGLPTTGSTPFFVTLTNIDPQAAAKITISKNDTLLLTVTPSNHAPTVAVVSPNGGETLAGPQLIAWQAADADGDTLFYDLLFSADGGQSWLPLAVRLGQTSYTVDTGQLSPSHDALIRVVASDGFNTSLDESDAPFSIDPTCNTPPNCNAPGQDDASPPPEIPPANGLSLTGPAIVQPGQTFEVSLMAHQIPEPGLFGLQFKLNFDPTLVRVDNLHLNPDLSLVAEQTLQNETGQVSVVASRQGQAPNLSGDFIIATFTLTAPAAGQVDLSLSDVVAGSRDGLPLELPVTPDLSLRLSDN